MIAPRAVLVTGEASGTITAMSGRRARQNRQHEADALFSEGVSDVGLRIEDGRFVFIDPNDTGERLEATGFRLQPDGTLLDLQSA